MPQAAPCDITSDGEKESGYLLCFTVYLRHVLEVCNEWSLRAL